ncbi:cuticle protein AM1159-like [Homarus americanus]|uniref:cuticle protein AM1159-like n=1 Tax=Homarus americanus TaxID=6706 RepID=UPI001C46ECE5|nr:cuticle protein AM1159-like [Homarus americanus]
MKLFVFACLVVLAAARPQKDAETVVDERSDSGDGNFNFNFETSHGISEQRTGVPGAEGQVNMEGVFRFPLEDGSIAEVRFIANENGYQPESALIPTSHPLPAHAIEQIAFAEEQRARGITFE